MRTYQKHFCGHNPVLIRYYQNDRLDWFDDLFWKITTELLKELKRVKRLIHYIRRLATSKDRQEAILLTSYSLIILNLLI